MYVFIQTLHCEKDARQGHIFCPTSLNAKFSSTPIAMPKLRGQSAIQFTHSCKGNS